MTRTVIRSAAEREIVSSLIAYAKNAPKGCRGMTMEEFKASVFEVFAAGYQAGYASDEDLQTAYERWFKHFRKFCDLDREVGLYL